MTNNMCWCRPVSGDKQCVGVGLYQVTSNVCLGRPLSDDKQCVLV